MKNTGRFWLLVAAACGLAACGVTGSSDPGTQNPPPSQGIVAGLVSDPAGHGVANAAICATAVFEANGTPVIVVTQGATNSSGQYLIPVNPAFRTDVRAHVTVAATPSTSSGLAPAYTPGLTLLIASTLPPAETTHADITVPTGTPYNGVFCVSGP
jgi:hypothetical protein